MKLERALLCCYDLLKSRQEVTSMLHKIVRFREDAVPKDYNFALSLFAQYTVNGTLNTIVILEFYYIFLFTLKIVFSNNFNNCYSSSK